MAIALPFIARLFQNRTFAPHLATVPLAQPQKAWNGPVTGAVVRGLPDAPAPQTLRVLRVTRCGGLGGPGAGRMVISGRMADVCQELDRLAALESPPQSRH